MRKLTDIVLDLLFVPRCAVCRERLSIPGGGLCARCRRAYDAARAEYCDDCGMEASVCRCMPQSLAMNGCVSYRKLAFYRSSDEVSIVRSMLYSLKRRHSKALAVLLASELAEHSGEHLPPDAVVTFAPRTAVAKRKYGYDQGELLAKNFAAVEGLEFRRLFFRRFRLNGEQKLLDAARRIKNVQDAFSIRRSASVAGKKIVLIDDVVTSGATLGACMRALYGAGAREVHCLSVAQTVRGKNKFK